MHGISCNERKQSSMCKNMMYRMAQKVNHYQKSSLNRIKTVSEARFFMNFEFKMSKNILFFVLNTICVT